MNRKITFAVALGAAIACVGSAQAANILLTAQYAGSYDSAFAPKGLELLAAPAPAPGGPAVSLPSDIHEFNVFMTLTGTAAGEDLESVAMDVTMGPGVTPLTVGEGGGWQTSSLDGVHDAGYKWDPLPNTTNVCATTGAGCQAVFGTNQDAGVANDLKGILVLGNNVGDSSFATFAGPHYRHPGEAEGQTGTDTLDNSPLGANLYVGSIWVHWNGSSSPTFLGLVDPANVASPLSTRDSQGAQLLFDAASVNQGPNQNWSTGAVVPEPTTLSLLSLAMVGILGLIRRR